MICVGLSHIYTISSNDDNYATFRWMHILHFVKFLSIESSSDDLSSND